MRNALLLAAVILALLGGCAKREGSGTDILGQKGGVSAATTDCVTPNADGVRCDKKTCKTDQQGDCNDFAARCIKYGHQYDGTRTQGTCTRIAQ